jgi:hypothetical protein
MICGMCGTEFTEEQAGAACKGCSLGGCGMLRCPRCGYEMPKEAALIKWLKGWRKKEHAKR